MLKNVRNQRTRLRLKHDRGVMGKAMRIVWHTGIDGTHCTLPAECPRTSQVAAASLDLFYFPWIRPAPRVSSVWSTGCWCRHAVEMAYERAYRGGRHCPKRGVDWSITVTVGVSHGGICVHNSTYKVVASLIAVASNNGTTTTRTRAKLPVRKESSTEMFMYSANCVTYGADVLTKLSASDPWRGCAPRGARLRRGAARGAS